ncbi:serine hydrolase [Prochlorococcus marinus]|uniref:serine hydrolase n=1 Tax=Prochlorococcus marinus TaxID=1219 RepID=UPI0022B433C5|nr:serine hydrolase [Prochlorococcus marinus]
MSGITIGVLVGTALKNVPINKQTKKVDSITNISNKSLKNLNIKYYNIDEVKKEWDKIDSANRDIEISGYVLLENGQSLTLNPNKILPSGSTINIYILLLCLEMIDKGKLQWDEKLTITPDIIAEGSGWMRYEPIGKEFPLFKVATEMIRVSDNTATNLLIERLGGIRKLRNKLDKLKLNQTKINSLLPDSKGTNKTTVQNLVKALKLANDGNFLSLKSRDLFREVLSTSITNSLIPEGLLKGLNLEQREIDYTLLKKGFRVFNKTGILGLSFADAAIIQMPNASNIFAGFIVQTPVNDPKASRIIQKLAASITNLSKKD